MRTFKQGLCTVLIFLFAAASVHAQPLKPVFDADEYLDMLYMAAKHDNGFFSSTVPAPVRYHRVYKSPEQGMHNQWDLWLNSDSTVMAINIRGTIATEDSWLENLYSAMIPATGTLTLSNNNVFHYQFAASSEAAVHAGWAVGVGAMAPGIMEQVKANYARGTKQLIISGHSQGGVLSYLLTSYLHYEQEAGRLPAGLVVKTYCSAAPKPGNLYYAYDFDYITRGGWAYNVVNAADWVPESPITVQTVKDFNKINPYTNAKKLLRMQKNMLIRLYALHVYNSMTRSSRKTQKKYVRYLGRTAYKRVKKFMPGLIQPAYRHSSNYMRAGIPVVLQPDAEYYKQYPDTGDNVFRHHLFKPYEFLVKKIYKQ